MTDDKDVAQLGEELVLSSSDDEIPEGESSPKHVPCSASVPPQPLSDNPEAFASQLLEKPWLEASDVLQLFEMLPMAVPQRGTEGKAFATGAFARVKVGLRTNVAVFPQASRVFASFVRQSAPGHKFTSVVVFEGVRTKPHRDQQNSCVPNLVVPLSSFEKGDIWVATDCGTVSRQVNGQQQKGVLLPVGAGPVLFDARRALHLTEPWKGRRVVLVAFSIGAFSRLSSEASERLSALQFNLPNQPDAAAFQERPQLPVRLPWPPRLPLLASAPSVPDIPKPAAGEPLFLELCAGTAMLSRCFHEVGVPVMPIDHQHNRHLPLAKVCNLSLTEDSTWDFLRHLIDTCDILFVHAAPPCGTCSMARHIRRKGVSAGPLRSKQFPMGLPSLNGVDRAKVEAANQIYTKLGRFLQDLGRRAIPWSVENPESSMLWQLPCFQPLVQDNHVFSFDMCCYGGSRLTHRSLLTSCFGLRHFRQRCSGGHEHLPWTPKVAPGGKVHFPTADEAAYPRPFCVQFVALVFRHLGRPLPATPAPQVSAQASASSARQPRGRRIPPVMPEFKRVLVYQVAALPQVDHKRRLLQPLRDAPAGSKLISSTSLLSEVGLSSASETTVQAVAELVDSSSSESGDTASPVGPDDQASTCFEVSLGVYASPEEFVDECLNVEHPFDQLHAAPDVLKQCLFDMLTKGPAWVVDRRAKLLKKWTQWARDLEAEEAGLRKSLDLEVAKVLQGKRLLLLEKIASSIGWVDMGVFAELRKGFDLVGHAKHTGVFALESRPPKLPKDDFLAATKFLRPALLGKVKSSSMDRNARELWEKTMQEVESGMLEGPLSSQQLDDRHPSGWLPTRRFGVEQTSAAGRKLRPVDDFTENKVNLAFGSMDKLDLNALDQLICTCRIWARAMCGGHDCELVLSSGLVLKGRVHPGWKKAGHQPLLTTLDLRAAYKQFAVSADSRAWAVIALLNPDTLVPGLFESKALPFGSAASVLHFNRLSRLLWRLGVELLIPWGNFFDDFPAMSPSAISDNTMSTMTALCSLLGFAFADDKLSPFQPAATMLGVEVDCSRCDEGLVLVRNKPGRAEELVVSLEEFLREGVISRKRYLSLMGRLHYTDSYILGKSGRLIMADIRSWARGHCSDELVLDDAARESLRLFIARLRACEPRQVPCGVASHVVHVFTDGASEGEVHSIGGVLVVPGRLHSCFGSLVPDHLISKWTSTMRHIIGPVESYAVAVARRVWHQFIASQRALFFIDNVQAQDSYIKGTSANPYVREILLSFEESEKLSPSWTWFARVASPSNVADEPSRAAFEFLHKAQCRRVTPSCPISGFDLVDLGALGKI